MIYHCFIISLFSDGNLLQGFHNIQSTTFLFIIYADVVTVDNFTQSNSILALRFIPLQYPKWVRTKEECWWTILLVPKILWKAKGPNFFLQKIIQDLDSHKGGMIYDAFLGMNVPFDFKIVAIIGDYPGRRITIYFIHITKLLIN